MAVVLVVEDEAHVLSLALLVLDRLGHVPIAARTFPEAELIIRSDRKFDLVFTDIVLAEHPEGGMAIGQLVQRLRFGTPILYTSGSGFSERIGAVGSAPHAFLQKPYTAQALARAVAILLGNRDDT